MYAYMLTCTRTYMTEPQYAGVCVATTYIRVCVCVHIYLCFYVCVCVYIYIYIHIYSAYTCLCVYNICIYMHIHVHIRAYTQSNRILGPYIQPAHLSKKIQSVKHTYICIYIRAYTQVDRILGPYIQPAHLSKKIQTEKEKSILLEDMRNRYEKDPYGNYVLKRDARLLKLGADN